MAVRQPWKQTEAEEWTKHPHCIESVEAGVGIKQTLSKSYK